MNEEDPEILHELFCAQTEMYLQQIAYNFNKLHDDVKVIVSDDDDSFDSN